MYSEVKRNSNNTDLDLVIGQVVKTVGNQIAVPDWHEVWAGMPDSKYDPNTDTGFKRLGNMPCIRLTPLPPKWQINTNLYRQSGLVCFIPKRYLGYAILAVEITKVGNKSVTADPIEYIEVANPLKLTCSDIGRDANEVFDSFLNDGRAIWHGKE